MADLAVSISYDPELVVALRGELDLATAGRLRSVIDTVYDDPASAPPVVAVDLHALRFLDSTGIAALVRGLKLARARGSRFYLRNVNDRCAMVLRATGLTSAVECDPPIDLTLVTDAPAG